MVATASAFSASPAPGPAASLLDLALIYVTGERGCGKSTVAAALRAAGAASGRRTLVCRLSGERNTEDSFGSARDHLGAEEPVSIGQAIDLTRPAQGRYDIVIADGPPTRQALRMLRAARTMGDIGPAGRQARELRDFLADGEATGYVAVTAPEELPARATLDLEAKLPAVTGHCLDLIVVNGVFPDLFSDEEAEQLEVLASRPRAPWGLRAALSHHRRARHHAEQLDRLHEQTHTPVLTLPYLFGPALGPAEYRWLARELMTQ
jgi:hypothetical protein